MDIELVTLDDQRSVERRVSLLCGFRKTPVDTYRPRWGFLTGLRRAIFTIEYASDLNALRNTILGALKDAASVAAAGLPLGSGMPPLKLKGLQNEVRSILKDADLDATQASALKTIDRLLTESLRIAEDPAP